jgi:hypothetical protein
MVFVPKFLEEASLLHWNDNTIEIAQDYGQQYERPDLTLSAGDTQVNQPSALSGEPLLLYASPALREAPRRDADLAPSVYT